MNKGERVIEVLNSGIIETNEIVAALAGKGLKIDPRYVRNIKTEWKKAKETTVPPPIEPSTDDSPLPPVDEPLTIEEIPDESVGVLNPAQIAVAPTVAKALTTKNISAIFSAINSLLPERSRRPEDQMELLGAVWEAPLNRVIGKYVDKNSDIYVAVVVTILVFAPAVPSLIPKKKIEENKYVNAPIVSGTTK